MKIGVLQVDGEFPNLALMQIASYHERRGDQVESYLGGLWNNDYDRIYVSKIFDYSSLPLLPDTAIIGGTGIDFYNTLPKTISEEPPSYLLYPDCDYHIGFTMKGCRFNCPFCCVPKKEGKPRYNSNIDDLLINPNGGNKLMLLDNDFFGSPEWEKDIRRIIELKLKVCFIQGLNIRIITQKQADLLSRVKYYNKNYNDRYVSFAWDRIDDEKLIDKGINICKQAGFKGRNMQFLMLIGYDTTPAQDYYRAMVLWERYGALPFVMPYNKQDKYQRKFARWVNRRELFKSVKWNDYNNTQPSQ